MSDAEHSVDALLEEQKCHMQRVQMHWHSWTQTLTIFPTGFVAAYFFAHANPDKAGPAFVVLPLLLLAWAVLAVVQANTLRALGLYATRLEREIRQRSSSPFPCWEATFGPALFTGALFRSVSVFISLVFLAICGESAYQATGFLSSGLGISVWLSGGGCVVCLLYALGLAYLYTRSVERGDRKLHGDLGEKAGPANAGQPQ